MGKRNLKDKISDVVFWTAVFIILYFLVAYLLESNWLEETLELGKVYSLLKDTLGLTAAFLAPVAALVLFNDWREEHKIKSFLSLLSSIKENAKDIEQLIVHFKENIVSRKIKFDVHYEKLKDFNVIGDKLIELNFLYQDLEIEAEYYNLEDYKQLIRKFDDQATYIKRLLFLLEEKSIIVKKYKDLNLNKDKDNQIYPIPREAEYLEDMEVCVEEMVKLESYVDSLIALTNKIKKEI